MWLSSIRDPIRFQGIHKKDNYFEGWYFKQVTADKSCVMSLIPGVSLSKADRHCFIQYIISSFDELGKPEMTTGYVRYLERDFSYKNMPFQVEVADNLFSRSSISVKIQDERIRIEGKLGFGPITPIRKTVLMPNIMGYYAYIPFMECYHGICSMSHALEGVLRVNGKEIDFSGGTGYVEKDWGTSFPKEYIWLQCNTFTERDISLMCSIADIPFGGRSFQGFIVNLSVGNQEYRFATYNRSKMHLQLHSGTKVTVTFENKHHLLRIDADAYDMGELVAPRLGKMQNVIKEGVSGTVSFQLQDKKLGKQHAGKGTMAGVEIVGYEETVTIELK